jgi:hypothetical protein
MKTSKKATSFAPFAAASLTRPSTSSRVASRSHGYGRRLYGYGGPHSTSLF